jgi:hypothetical protein
MGQWGKQLASMQPSRPATLYVQTAVVHATKLLLKFSVGQGTTLCALPSSPVHGRAFEASSTQSSAQYYWAIG